MWKRSSRSRSAAVMVLTAPASWSRWGAASTSSVAKSAWVAVSRSGIEVNRPAPAGSTVSAAVREEDRHRDLLAAWPGREEPIDRVIEPELIVGDQLERHRGDEELRHASGEELTVSVEAHVRCERTRDRHVLDPVVRAEPDGGAGRSTGGAVPVGDGIEARAVDRHAPHGGGRRGPGCLWSLRHIGPVAAAGD